MKARSDELLMRTLAILFVGLACSTCSSTRGGAGERSSDRGVAPWTETAPLDEMMIEFIERHDVPGAALAVSKGGEVVYSRGFGFAELSSRERVQPESLFRIASISKPITAVAVMQLVERGALSLDENPFKVIGFGHLLDSAGCDERLERVTVRHLLAHQGGWDRSVSYDPMFQTRRIQEEFGLTGAPGTRDIIRFMLSEPLDFDPGERYAYSNFGYCVLGRVIEAVTGAPYDEAVRARVLTPLGIEDMQIGRSLPEDRVDGEVVYHDQEKRARVPVKARGRRVPIGYAHDQEVMDSHGAWIASAADLARFAGAFSDPSSCPLLTEESVGAMWAPQKEQPGAVWYGLGWQVRDVGGGRKNAWHTGLLTGGTSTIMVRRHDGLSWAVLFNTDRSGTSGETLSGLIDPLVHRAVNEVKELSMGW